MYNKEAYIMKEKQKIPDHICTTAEDFVNELIDSICKDAQELFRQRYVEAEELVVLDFDYLKSRPVSMAEFEKIWNEREKYGRRTILQ